MKRKILHYILFSFISTAGFNAVSAQTNSAYAITGAAQGDITWNNIRQIDLSTGALIRNIYVSAVDKPELLDAVSGRPVIIPSQANAQPNPTPSLIAAAAYDAKYNRIYYTTMLGLDLRYVDLNAPTLKIYSVQDQMLKAFKVLPGEDDNITRMTFGADGNGYALTNDGNHLIRFTTGPQIQITDLGSLKDAIENENNSVHTPQQNWGGDMIGDAFGNLYLFTVQGNVFKINPQTMVANFEGEIKNLPKGFTVNGAAVDVDGAVIVSSALCGCNYYKVDLATLNASELIKNSVATPNSNIVFNASDFANGNLAYSKEAANIKSSNVVTVRSIKAFPNPVQNKTFVVEFNGFTNTQQNIEVLTLSGKKIYSQQVDATAKDQTVHLPSGMASGMYVVKVVDAAGYQSYTDKIVVE